jgi:perosamine synthetase
MIPYGRQLIDEEDRRAVDQVLSGEFLTQGPAVQAFEQSIIEYVGVKHAVSFNSGTSALHAAAYAARLGPGDLVVTSPLTFMATPNAARYVGAKPGLVDIDRKTWNIDLSLLPSNAAAVLPVHYAGLPVDLAPLVNFGGVVIEDAAHALGAHTPNGPVGNCHTSDMCCFSFHPVKPITSGEGGVVTTNDDELADRLRTFRTIGVVRMPEKGSWYYEISELGFNYRMTDIHAALGLSQMKKLDKYIQIRNDIADSYRELLVDDELELPVAAPVGFRHGYHLFPVLVENRAAVFEEMRKQGIFVQVHYVPVHHHPISVDIQTTPEALAVCDFVYERILSLPVHPSLTSADQRYVVETLRTLISGK